MSKTYNEWNCRLEDRLKISEDSDYKNNAYNV